MGARFSPPVQIGPGAQPASYKMGTESFPGVKRQGLGVDHPPPSTAEVEERVQLCLYSPSGPSCPVLGRTLPLPLALLLLLLILLAFNVRVKCCLDRQSLNRFEILNLGFLVILLQGVKRIQ